MSSQDFFVFSSISSFFLCISLLITITIIMSITKYSMASIAVSKGDVGSAANIMSEGKYANYKLPLYNQSYQQPVYETTKISKTNSIIIITVIWCLFVFGASLYMYYTNKQSREMKDTNKWSTVEGIVTFSKIISNTISSTSGTGIRKTTTHNIQYAPEISYDYTINNIKYNNNQVYPNGGFTNMESTAQKYVNANPIGKKIIVIYNVNNPSESFLEYDQGTSLTYPILLILFITTLCGYILYQCYGNNNCLTTYDNPKNI